MPGIYLRQGARYVAMAERQFSTEDELQALIAQHPEMLADPDAGQSPLLLIRREAGVSDQEENGNRWSLDHLYIDGRGIPTLVEVKRSTDTRARREVVAQMLDYAANAKTSFSAERMAAWLDDAARMHGTTADDVLAEAFGVEDPDDFWTKVVTNLDAERFRLVFVSDAIAPELRRIIEFLNGQMERTDVLAIEVKQYTDTTGEHQTVVPRLIGDTEQAKQTKRASRGPLLDRTALLRLLDEDGEDARRAGDAVLTWAEEHRRLSIRFTRTAAVIEFAGRPLVKLWAQRGLEVTLQTLGILDGAWDAERLDGLVAQLEQIEGVQFDEGRRWPKTPLAPLADGRARRALLTKIEEVIVALPRA